RFTDLLPITYTINITGTGNNLVSTTVQHKVELDSATNLPVVISAPSGSVQGNLHERATTGALNPLAGHIVHLVPTDPVGDTRPAATTSTGRFVFGDVPAGEYEL